MYNKAPGTYDVTVKFGEYASPDFETTVDTVGKAKQYGVMSVETSVDQLYGDTWTDEEKAEEVARLKAEQGIVEMEEPAVSTTAGSFDVDTGGDGDAGNSNGANISDEPGRVRGAA